MPGMKRDFAIREIFVLSSAALLLITSGCAAQNAAAQQAPTVAPSSVPTKTANPVKIKKLTQCSPQCLNPAWSPDGKQIAYFNGDSSKIFVMDADGSHVRFLGVAFQAVWSPDGTHLALISGEISGGQPGLSVVNAEGTDPIHLITGASMVSWSPDSTRLAFVAPTDQGNELSVIGVDGQGLRSLFKTTVPIDQLAWSPDGTRLAFVAPTDQGNDLSVIGADGQGLRSLFKTIAPIDQMVWPAGGSQIYYMMPVNSVPVIYRAEADGSGVTEVGALPSGALDAVFSPDGTQVAYNGDGGVRVEIANIDGSDRRILAPQTSGALAWSADGMRIAFGSKVGDDFDIFVINADGSGLVNVTNHPGFADTRPAWSPDGSRLAFISQTYHKDYGYAADDQIYVVELSAIGK